MSNPEIGGERQFNPEEEKGSFKKWQLAGPSAREILLLEESDEWPPVERKKEASPRARKFARESSILAVEAANIKRPR